MHLILYGPEGSGKGTQAEKLSVELNLPIYTSGDLVRDAAKNDKGEIGNAARRALSHGVYVPDREMFLLWENKLKSEEAKKGFILDGFPRNIEQAKFIKALSIKSGYFIDSFIFLNLSEVESIKRLSLRHRNLFEGSNINHDEPERVKQRLKTYKSLEKEIVEFYDKEGLLLEVDASGNVEEIFGRIKKGLNI